MADSFLSGWQQNLVVQHLGLVETIARSLRVRGQEIVPFDELYGAGCVGLVVAAMRYRPEEGTLFATFAQYRIRGAMIDHVRAASVITRGQVKLWQERQKTIRALAQALMRMPDSDEVAASMGIPLRKYFRIDLPQTLSLEQDILQESDFEPDHLTNRHGSSVHPVAPGPDPLARIADGELVFYLAQAVEQLPPQQRQTINLYYQDALSMIQIAELMGLTEGRISQILTESRAALRRTLSTFATRKPKEEK